MAEEVEVVKIIPSVLTQQINDGMKLKPLAEHYGLPVMQMKTVLRQLGLTIRKFHAPKFVIVNEEESEAYAVTEQDLKENPELKENGVVEGDIITTLEKVQETQEEVISQEGW